MSGFSRILDFYHKFDFPFSSEQIESKNLKMKKVSRKYINPDHNRME